MEIRQIQGYRIVSLITLIVSLAAAYPIADSENLKIAGFISGALGSFLLGLAAISVTLRFVFHLFSKINHLGFARFVLGLVLMLAVAFAWFFAVMKLAVVPAVNGEVNSEFVLPALLGVVNGGSGVLYFYFIWPFKQKFVLVHGS